MLILTISKIILLCLLAGFIALPLLAANNDLTALNTINIQIARAEYLVQAVETLEYRPISFHSEAVGGIETSLPTFQQVQNGLLNGNSALGLESPPPDIDQMLVANGANYSALVAALKAILAHPSDRPDLTQVDIVMAHAQPYAVALYQISFVLTQHAQERRIWIIVIELVLVLIIFADILIGYIVLIRPTLKAAQREEQLERQQKHAKETKNDPGDKTDEPT